MSPTMNLDSMPEKFQYTGKVLNTGQTLCLIRKDAPGDEDDETDHETVRQMHMPATARTREEWELYVKNGHAADGLHHHVILIRVIRNLEPRKQYQRCNHTRAGPTWW